MRSSHIGILANEQMRSCFDVGSSRIRALWLTKYWPDSELFRIGKKYNTIIFQKAYWVDYAMEFDGIKILDICDPDFLRWDSPCITMANHSDAVTTSTEALALTIAKYTTTPTFCIPDRLDLGCFKRIRKDHAGNGQTKVAAWFGYCTNFPALDFALPDLQRLGIERLIVISERSQPYVLPIEFRSQFNVITRAWNFTKLHEDLSDADILINYRLTSGRWRYKSNNKTLFGWAVGLPVAHTTEELETLMSEGARIAESKFRLAELDNYDVRKSVEDYKSLIGTIEAGRLGRSRR